MTTYREVNAVWPGNCAVPTPQEAIAGVKRLIRVAHRHAQEEGYVGFKPAKYRYKVTSGNRHTWPRRGTWYVNPNEKRWNGSGGWAEITHSVSHWAQRKFWPKENPHGPRHVFLEKMLAEYAIHHFLDGQLKRREKATPDPVQVRRERVNAAIKRWEAKKRRAENALRKLRKQAKYYERQSGNPGVPSARADWGSDGNAMATSSA